MINLSPNKGPWSTSANSTFFSSLTGSEKGTTVMALSIEENFSKDNSERARSLIRTIMYFRVLKLSPSMLGGSLISFIESGTST
jgi:hypothetical protein